MNFENPPESRASFGKSKQRYFSKANNICSDSISKDNCRIIEQASYDSEIKMASRYIPDKSKIRKMVIYIVLEYMKRFLLFQLHVRTTNFIK